MQFYLESASFHSRKFIRLCQQMLTNLSPPQRVKAGFQDEGYISKNTEGYCLTHCSRVTHICIGENSHHWFR